MQNTRKTKDYLGIDEVGQRFVVLGRDSCLDEHLLLVARLLLQPIDGRRGRQRAALAEFGAAVRQNAMTQKQTPKQTH